MKKLTERAWNNTNQMLRANLSSQWFQLEKDKKWRPQPQLLLWLVMNPKVHQEIFLSGC
jgi:hypothetical protein